VPHFDFAMAEGVVKKPTARNTNAPLPAFYASINGLEEQAAMMPPEGSLVLLPEGPRLGTLRRFWRCPDSGCPRRSARHCGACARLRCGRGPQVYRAPHVSGHGSPDHKPQHHEFSRRGAGPLSVPSTTARIPRLRAVWLSKTCCATPPRPGWATGETSHFSRADFQGQVGRSTTILEDPNYGPVSKLAMEVSAMRLSPISAFSTLRLT